MGLNVPDSGPFHRMLIRWVQELVVGPRQSREATKPVAGRKLVSAMWINLLEHTCDSSEAGIEYIYTGPRDVQTAQEALGGGADSMCLHTHRSPTRGPSQSLCLLGLCILALDKGRRTEN